MEVSEGFVLGAAELQDNYLRHRTRATILSLQPLDAFHSLLSSL